MIDFSSFFEDLEAQTKLARNLALFKQRIDEACSQKNGNLPAWIETLEHLPKLRSPDYALDQDTLRIGKPGQLNDEQRAALEQQLRSFMPWRKGPFEVFGIPIDTEWRSDWKWQRIAPHLASLEGRCVLDIGSGSGYHCWRMHGAGASFVLGIEPWWLYVVQFYVIKHFIGEVPVHTLPLGIQDLPPNMQAFDTVFSMGVLYHRKAPIEHLQQLLQCLRPGGELALETLVIDGGSGQVLVPDDRYAKMKNVWFIPSAAELERWAARAGFKNIRLVDINQTSTEEQRATDWMTGESLPDFLDQRDPNLTIEGYPAPKRAILIANRP